MAYNKKKPVTDLRAALFIVFVFACYFVAKNLMTSVYLKSSDKINIVFYGEKTRYFSIDKKDTDYVVNFTPGARVLVPGGYGFYNIGAIAKLVELEKKPELIRKTFSAATSSFVDLYFYPPKTDIFYTKSANTTIIPGFKEIFLYTSNANLLDRIFLYITLINQNQNFFRVINTKDDFDSQKFGDENQGSFYKKAYRNLGDNVQITYTNDYNTAVLISNIIDGEGIRVVDLEEDTAPVKSCEVVTAAGNVKSAVVEGISRFFKCRVRAGDTERSDIILRLGNLEHDWAAK